MTCRPRLDSQVFTCPPVQKEFRRGRHSPLGWFLVCNFTEVRYEDFSADTAGA